MKYRILTLLIIAVVALASKGPGDEQRDPVPDEQIVAHSVHCAGCHGYDPTGVAMTTPGGEDVNLYDDWRVSMMAYSARDPFWRATVQHEVSLFPSAQEEIEATCLKCHAPLGSQQRAYDGLTYSYADMLADSLGQDGVSCVACHQQSPETYGKRHSGNITLNTDRLIYGPHPEPFEGPMELYVGFAPAYTDLIYTSGVCAGCHTLITATRDADGMLTGDHFVEQATYHEWLNSSYVIQGKECQNCHIPVIQDSVVLATDLKGLQKRSPFGVHQFRGANTAMLTLMQDNADALGLPLPSTEEAWNQSISLNRQSLRGAGEVMIEDFVQTGDTLYVTVRVQNLAGHKLPSGYPSRVAWLQVAVTNALTGDTLYVNGTLNPDGNIAGRDTPFEPHHEISLSPDDVQIYEMVMEDVAGEVTTRLSAALRPRKDNRLLPKGFRRNHTVYDTVAVYGSADLDPDYGVQSAAGADRIEYRIPINGFEGIANIGVSLRYHTFPARWMHDLFQNDGIADIASFKSMYAGYETFTELIDSTGLEDVLIGSSAVAAEDEGALRIWPNPVTNGVLHIDGITGFETQYQVIQMDGVVVQAGVMRNEIVLPDQLCSGTYFLVIRDDTRKIFVKKFVVLNGVY